MVETHQTVNMAALQQFFVEQGVWIRPFSRLIYLMPPYIITPQVLSKLVQAIGAALEHNSHFADRCGLSAGTDCAFGYDVRLLIDT